MKRIYTPASWYWIVAGDSAQVFSSARASYVPSDDETYAAWLAAGNRPTRIASEAELAAVLRAAGVATDMGTPEVVPMASARIVLLRRGITDADVRSAIASSAMTVAQKAEALIDWEFRGEVHRPNPLVALLGALLGLTDAQIDELFVEAEKV